MGSYIASFVIGWHVVSFVIVMVLVIMGRMDGNSDNEDLIFSLIMGWFLFDLMIVMMFLDVIRWPGKRVWMWGLRKLG